MNVANNIIKVQRMETLFKEIFKQVKNKLGFIDEDEVLKFDLMYSDFLLIVNEWKLSIERRT